MASMIKIISVSHKENKKTTKGASERKTGALLIVTITESNRLLALNSAGSPAEVGVCAVAGSPVFPVQVCRVEI